MDVTTPIYDFTLKLLYAIIYSMLTYGKRIEEYVSVTWSGTGRVHAK
jgi:hypothetical protein